MRRKLLMLDLVLAGVAVAAGVQFHKAWQAAKAREAVASHRHVKPVALPPLPALPKEPEVAPSTYVDVAAKMLFDPSRDPNVVVVPPPPPPPKPVPPFPVYHGVMNLGLGPMVILSAKAGDPQQAVHPGEPIGQFTLVDVHTDGITLEWDGKKFFKTAEELSDHGQNTAAGAPAASARTAQPAAPAPPPTPAKVGPGEDTAFGWKTCNMNDGLAPGTVMEGYRKTITNTAFGKTCTWDPVK